MKFQSRSSKWRSPAALACTLLVAALCTPAYPGRMSVASAAAPSDPRAAERELDELLRRGGCMLCHRWSRPWIGPSFLEIARRLGSLDSAGRDDLVARLRRGTVGNHSPILKGPCDTSRLTEEELRRVIDYVLTSSPRNDTGGL